MQVPPVFSACKVEGKRAYDLARKGQKAEEVQLKAKPLRIDEIELLEADLGGEAPSITIRVVCSKGTYIRALARDIGEALNSGAHLTALRRTRVGSAGRGNGTACLLKKTYNLLAGKEQISLPAGIIRDYKNNTTI